MKEKADRPRVVSKYAVVNNKKMGKTQLSNYMDRAKRVGKRKEWK